MAGLNTSRTSDIGKLRSLFSVVNPSSWKSSFLSCPFASLASSPSSLARSSESKTTEVKREADLAVGTTRRAHPPCKGVRTRSEERRVGKEGRYRGSAEY